MEIINQIRQLIGQAKLEQAITLLLTIKTKYNDIIIGLQAQLTNLKNKELAQIINADHAKVERNTINHSLLSILSKIEKESASPATEAKKPYTIPDNEGLEKIIDKNGLKPIDWYHKVSQYSKSVCKIHTADGYVGTGFLVEGGYIFTNNHVIESAAIAQYSKVEFGYDAKGADSTFYNLDHRDFVTSKQLDYTKVKVSANQEALSKWGTLKISSVLPKQVEDLVIIQHPQGRVKEIAYSEGTKNSIWEHRLHYKITTEPGSSGAPVFNINWKVVAIHHAGGNLKVNAAGDEKYTNEGILFKYINADLANATSADTATTSTNPSTIKETSTRPIKTLLVYNKKDVDYANKLDSHLFPYSRTGDMKLFDIHQDVPPAANKEVVLQQELETSAIILILISESIYQRDTREIALKVEKLVESKRVIPIKVAPFVLKGTAFAPLQGLPRNVPSLSECENLDTEMYHIALEIKRVIDLILKT